MKVRCACGQVLRLSGEIPNPIEWRVISDVRFDDFAGTVDAEAVYLASRSMFECPTCGRLWFFRDGLDGPPSIFAPERVEPDPSAGGQDPPSS